MAIDRHYTPADLAEAMVRQVRLTEPTVVADFAAGAGALLAEAQARWPSARLVATDVDRSSIGRLAKLRLGWDVGRCDFLNQHSRRSCQTLRLARGRVSLLLLNPPFSSRGGSTVPVASRASGNLSSSPAMAFLLLGLDYLAADGRAVAILPSGSLHNRKDRPAWTAVRQRFNVRTLARWRKGAFPDCAASTVLVELAPKVKCRSPRTSRPVAKRKGAIRVEVVRGTCPVHALPDRCDGPTLVHSSDLKHRGVILNGHRGFGTFRCLRGPAVLIPRVGAITRDKVCLLNESPALMLSDCVIGLRAKSTSDATRVHELMLRHFGRLRGAYVGTGAPHVTLERLIVALGRIGIEAQ